MVMNVIDAIYGRRAVRTYAPRPVDEGTIRRLLRAATHAPSAMNAQPWLFAVVQNRAQLARYSDLAKLLMLELASADLKARRYDALLRETSFNVFYDAGTLVAIGVAEPGPYADADCWLAAEALMLAAHDAGLGTCPIGFAVPLLNDADVKKELGFPESALIVSPIIVGYPSTTVSEVPRREPRIVSWSKE